MRLAVTADLHWGVRAAGDEATRLLVADLYHEPPDVLVLAGDVGAGDDFGRCLELFDNLKCRKALVPGNHDIWVSDEDRRGDSLQVYRQHLPEVCAAHDFHYLDAGPLLLPEASVALAGSMNWYDYSWSLERLKQEVPDWEERLRTKRFSRGRHNDVRFVRWPLDDVQFTAETVETLRRHLEMVLPRGNKAIVVTHHPAFYGVSFPRPENEPLDMDDLLWDAFGGNQSIEQLLLQYAEHVPLVFCGHTHRARENTLGPIRGFNVGGDYHFKRLLRVEWPAGTVEAHTYGAETV